MDNKFPQYQRAVTPTIDTASTGSMRGKVISYTSNRPKSSVGTNGFIASSSERLPPSSAKTPTNRGLSSNLLDANMNIQGRNASNNASTSNLNIPKTPGSTTRPTYDQSNLAISSDQFNSLSVLPRYDLVPIQDELPADGIIFAKIRNQPDISVVFRTPEERLRNPERLNLDRRNLEGCPLLEQEHRLRLLNYQNNHIKFITNIENLSNLIFLDLYNNQIQTLDGPLNTAKGLRVLMAGKNKITQITNLSSLKKLDVLDLHSNEIKVIEGLETLNDLRVLNLAGNRIVNVNSLSNLTSLTELNLRRNQIQYISDLDKLPSLQRIFLSHNMIQSFVDVSSIFRIPFLIELSMDGNPVSENDPLQYRHQIICNITSLKHLDLKRITDEERSQAIKTTFASQLTFTPIQPSEVQAPNPLETSTTSELKPKSGGLSLLETLKGETDFSLPSSPYTKTRKSITIIRENQSTNNNSSNNNTQNTQSSEAPESVEIVDQVPSLRPQASNSQDTNIDYGATSPSYLDPSPLSSTPGNKQSNNSPSKASLDNSLITLARQGKIPKSQTIFDIEIVSPTEKALIVVGELWDWNQLPKRLLSGVTEVVLLHVRKEIITQKFLLPSYLSMLTSLKTVSFLDNEFNQLKQLDFIIQYFNSIEHLIIKDNPIVSHICNSQSLVDPTSHEAINIRNVFRPYFISQLPKLLSFNQEMISDEERKQAGIAYGPLLSLIQTPSTFFASLKKDNDSSNNNNNNSPSKRNPSRKASILGTSASKPQLKSNANTSKENNSTKNTESFSFEENNKFANLNEKYQQYTTEFDVMMHDLLANMIVDYRQSMQLPPLPK